MCETLAIAFTQRQKPAFVARSKYDYLIADAVLASEEMELAQRAARQKGHDLEDVLINQFTVKPAAIGAALSRFFEVPYEPFKPERLKPVELLRNIKREFVDESAWLPLEDSSEGLIVMSPDPERLRSSRIVNNIFPKAKITYRVTTLREFAATVDQFFGAISDMG